MSAEYLQFACYLTKIENETYKMVYSFYRTLSYYIISHKSLDFRWLIKSIIPFVWRTRRVSSFALHNVSAIRKFRLQMSSGISLWSFCRRSLVLIVNQMTARLDKIRDCSHCLVSTVRFVLIRVNYYVIVARSVFFTSNNNIRL